jgi:formate hydrogenlyase subunit 3/multisubunit Na+/H+ antiporter MnhD subunit
MNLLVLPILLVGIGALLGVLGVRPSFRLASPLATVSVGLSLLAIVLLGRFLPSTAILSDWSPKALFPNGLALRADGLSWLLGLVFLLGTFGVYCQQLTTQIFTTQRPAWFWVPLGLILTTVTLLAIFADGLVTVAISWAAVDVLMLGTVYALLRTLDLTPEAAAAFTDRAVLALAVNLTASILVVAAALAANTQASSATLPPNAALFLLGAGLARLSIYPTPSTKNNQSDLTIFAVLFRLAPVTLAVKVLTTVVLFRPELPWVGWLSAISCAILLASAWHWWTGPDFQRRASAVALAQIALLLLTVLWGGSYSALGVLGIGLGLLLGGAALFLFPNQWKPNRAIRGLTLLAIAVLVGLPPSIGFLGTWAVVTGLADAGQWLALLVVLLSQALLVAGYLRTVLGENRALVKDIPPSTLPKLSGSALVITVASIGLPALVGALLGLRPADLGRFLGISNLLEFDQLFTPIGYLAVGGALLALLLGGVLWYFDSVLRAGYNAAQTAAAARSRLRGSFWQSYRLLGQAVRTVSHILEGEGGVLWTLVFALLIWLVLRSR